MRKLLSKLAIFLWQAKKFVLTLILFLPFLLGSAKPVILFAQSTDPIEESLHVTATMPDVVAPSTPILIAPTNNSLITDSTPEFIWTNCTDNVALSYFQLYLDGEILFNSIPLTNTDNSSYILTLDPVTDYYHLIPKTSLTEGGHTWKVRVYDTAENYAESVTWSFTIDSQAPTFVITEIGSVSTSISVQDLGTIPTEPISLEDNEPLLQGTGEANSTVAITITIPGDPTQNDSFTINEFGSWQYQIGILPRGTIITLDFLITDQAGNISVLEGIQLIIEEIIIIIPPQPTATPTTHLPPSPTPTELPPGVPSPTPTLLNPSPTLIPQIRIPLLPPKEIIHEATQEILERIPFISNLINALPESIKKVIKNLAPISSIIVSSAIPIISTIAVASQFGGQLSFNILVKILQALGLIPTGKPQGLIFDSETNKGVPFAVLTITNVGEKLKLAIHEKIIANDDGLYHGIKLPSGKYQLAVQHVDYLFPTEKNRPIHLGIKDYYKGEIFQIDNDRKPEFLLVPMDPLKKLSGTYSRKSSLRLFLTRLTRFSSALLIPLFLFSLIIVSFYPTLWNWAMAGLYGALIFFKIKNRFIRPDISGTILDEDTKQPVENVIIKLIEIATNEVSALTFTDQQGHFAFYKQQGEYQIIPTKPDYIWKQAGTRMHLETIDSRERGVNSILLMMKSSEEN